MIVIEGVIGKTERVDKLKLCETCKKAPLGCILESLEISINNRCFWLCKK